MICGTCRTSGFKNFGALSRHWEKKDACVHRGWSRVRELREKGQNESAARVARRLLGIRGPAMDEETKAKLRAWKEEHREEIRERRLEKQTFKRRVIELSTTQTLRRKR